MNCTSEKRKRETTPRSTAWVTTAVFLGALTLGCNRGLVAQADGPAGIDLVQPTEPAAEARRGDEVTPGLAPGTGAAVPAPVRPAKMKSASDPATAGASPGTFEFTLHPRQGVMGSLVSYYRPIRVPLTEEPAVALVKEPEYLSGKPQYGVLELGEEPNHRIMLVVDEAEGHAPRIYIDRNNDKDLTNDGPGEWSRTAGSTLALNDVVIEVAYSEGKVPYTFRFYRFKDRLREYVLYYRDAYREGKITSAGQQYKVAILDDNSDGRFDDLENGSLIIDLNQDGRLEGASDSAEMHKLGAPFNIHGQVWEVASLSPDGTKLVLRPSEAEVAMKRYLDPGYPAPVFSGSDLAGNPVELERAATGAKYVLLDFWASWCGPCRHEFSTFRRLHHHYKNHGLRIIGVNLDHGRSEAQNAIAEAGLDYPHVFDGQGWKNAVAVMYRVHGIPQTYLLDHNLDIVAKGLRGQRLAAKLRELLGPGDEPDAEPAAEAPTDRRAAPGEPPKPGPAGGFLVTTRQGLRLVSGAGEVRELPEQAGNLHGEIGQRGDKLFFFHRDTIREIDRNGAILRTVRVPAQARGLGFAVLPNARFALLDNREDRIHVIDDQGRSVADHAMHDSPDNHLQNVHGLVVGESLIVSEDGNNRLLKVDLAENRLSVFRDFQHLRGWLGAITGQDGTYYLCQATKIYSFRDSEPEKLLATLPKGNITGIVVDGGLAYVTLNFPGQIRQVDLRSGRSVVFAEKLDYPDGLVRLPDPAGSDPSTE